MQSPSKETDGSGEEHKGLYEKPLTVEGKRRRTSTQAYTVPSETKKQLKQYEGGSGEKLGDIALVEQHLTRRKTDELKALHRLCFDRAGTKAEIKKNLRGFSGFTFARDGEQYTRKKAALGKNTKSGLKDYLCMFGLALGGGKEEQVERVMDWLMEPKGTGKKTAPTKKRSSSQSKAPPAKKRRVAKKSPNKRSKGKPVMSDSDETGDDELVLDDEESEKEEEEEEEEEEEGEEGEEEDGEGDKAEAGAKEAPSDDQLTSTIRQLLKDADLNTATANTLCQQVLGKFPDFDISSKTDFIKSTIEKELANF